MGLIGSQSSPKVNFKKYIFIYFLWFFHPYLFSQCVLNIESDSLKIPCNGATLNLRAVLDNVVPLMDNNFNDSSVGAGWVSSPAVPIVLFL